jgi:hypothetical protein
MLHIPSLDIRLFLIAFTGRKYAECRIQDIPYEHKNGSVKFLAQWVN